MIYDLQSSLFVWNEDRDFEILNHNKSLLLSEANEITGALVQSLNSPSNWRRKVIMQQQENKRQKQNVAKQNKKIVKKCYIMCVYYSKYLSPTNSI